MAWLSTHSKHRPIVGIRVTCCSTTTHCPWLCSCWPASVSDTQTAHAAKLKIVGAAFSLFNERLRHAGWCSNRKIDDKRFNPSFDHNLYVHVQPKPAIQIFGYLVSHLQVVPTKKSSTKALVMPHTNACWGRHDSGSAPVHPHGITWWVSEPSKLWPWNSISFRNRGNWTSSTSSTVFPWNLFCKWWNGTNEPWQDFCTAVLIRNMDGSRRWNRQLDFIQWKTCSPPVHLFLPFLNTPIGLNVTICFLTYWLLLQFLAEG